MCRVRWSDGGCCRVVGVLDWGGSDLGLIGRQGRRELRSGCDGVDRGRWRDGGVAQGYRVSGRYERMGLRWGDWGMM